jgi:hypothetical protein
MSCHKRDAHVTCVGDDTRVAHVGRQQQVERDAGSRRRPQRECAQCLVAAAATCTTRAHAN